VACVDSHGVTRMPTEEVAVLTKRLVDQVTAESDREEAQ
ncbi:proteasome subunit beta, partial [Micromonospora sp. AMSO31t]